LHFGLCRAYTLFRYSIWVLGQYLR
jgi:hypothetical protein